jgi:hypothetical protein
MVIRPLEVPEDTERKLQLASAAYRMSCHDFVLAAINTALACSAAEVPAIAEAFKLAVA